MESRICLKNLFSTQWSDAHYCRKYLNFSSVCLFEKLWSKYKACMQRISQLLDNYTPYTFSFIFNIFFYIRIEKTKVNVSTYICKKKKIIIARCKFVILFSTNNLFETKARFYVHTLLIIESHEVCILLHTNYVVLNFPRMRQKCFIQWDESVLFTRFLHIKPITTTKWFV